MAFHKFPLLPPEIRLMIWEQALRPEVSMEYLLIRKKPLHQRVHTIRLDNQISCMTRQPAEHHSYGTATSGGDEDEWSLEGTASSSTVLRHYRPWNNPLLRFIDAGMRLACRESRYIFLKRHRKPIYPSKYRDTSHGRLRRSRSEPLVVLRCSASARDMTDMLLPDLGNTNVAFEFCETWQKRKRVRGRAASWNDYVAEDSDRGFCIRAIYDLQKTLESKGSCLRRITFIDRSIKPVEARPGLAMFSDGRHKYVELFDLEKGREWDYLPVVWFWVVLSACSTLGGSCYLRVLVRAKE